MRSDADTLNKYRVHLTVRGSIVKPSYDGSVTVFAEDEDEAFDRAVTRCIQTAHWDSPRSDFRLDKIERIG
jgi:hypothetical protein